MKGKSDEMKPLIYMAPLKGITDATFRRVFQAHFNGVDRAVAPFINPQSKSVSSDKLLKDILPEHNCSLPLVPQILNTDAAGFLALSERLYELGYSEINWNLGCPVKMVARKSRGSGLLPHPDRIVSLLDQVMPRLKPRLSIKMRLGYREYRESLELLPRLDAYPLSEIIIHARLGTQLYEGSVSEEYFERCAQRTRHILVYNGDLATLADYERCRARFSSVNRWMIGRGLLVNPFLPEEIKGRTITAFDRLLRLKNFHDDLFQALKERLSGPGHLLGRMKQVWIYFIGAFPDQARLLKKITRANSEANYLAAVEKIICEGDPQ